MTRPILSTLIVLLLFIYPILSQDVEIRNSANALKLLLNANGPAQGGQIDFFDNDGTTTCVIGGNHGANEGAYMNMYTGDGIHTIQLDAHHYGGGQMYLKDHTGKLAVHLMSRTGTSLTDNDAVVEMHDAEGLKRVHLGAADGLFQTTNLTLYGSSGLTTMGIGGSTFTGGFINMFDAAGIQTITVLANPGTGGFHLKVDGKMLSEELRIMDSANWPDYVFQSDYPLPSIDEYAESISRTGHLPGIPSANVIEENGIDVGDIQKKQMEKIEELTLYIIQLHKRIEKLEQNQ